MATKMVNQLSHDIVNSKIIQEFDEREVSLEKIVDIIIKRLDIDNKFKPIVMYGDPFEFYISTNENGNELKLTSNELFLSCNSIEDEDEYFLDVDDMMNEMRDILGGEPLDLISRELSKNPQILACMKKI